jgi:hypothetical protein
MCSDTNLALHFYSNENAKTVDGVLRISTERKENVYRAFNEKTKKYYVDKKYIQSAMVQSWNKFCFTGGIVEFSAKLPGSPRIGGLWPARKYSTSNIGQLICLVSKCAYIMVTLLHYTTFSLDAGKSGTSNLRWIFQLYMAI